MPIELNDTPLTIRHSNIPIKGNTKKNNLVLELPILRATMTSSHDVSYLFTHPTNYQY